jgi:SAM-dependent MidA family methyltransferase
MSAFDAGLRRTPVPSLDVGDEPELVRRIRAEIEERGPITFARFMERALYEPRLGYYRKDAPGPGRQGDFLTAPETHPVFGRVLARQLDELWQAFGRPQIFTLREHGAGSGALALSMLQGLAADDSEVIAHLRYEAVEIDDRRIEAIRRRLVEAGFDQQIEPLEIGGLVGVVLANELLDALPVHRVVGRPGGIRELMVAVEGDRFVHLEAEPSTEQVTARLQREGVVLDDGQIAEVCLDLDGWIEGAVAGLERGLLLLIDYGYAAAKLYGPERRAGTLMAYVGHRAHDDPFVNVGRQDLTAHVDLTAVESAAERAGLAKVGVTTQAEFLAGLGIGDLLTAAQAESGTSLESYLELRASMIRLLDPRVTGAFRVMAFGRGLPKELHLKGFEFRLPPRRRATAADQT